MAPECHRKIGCGGAKQHRTRPRLLAITIVPGRALGDLRRLNRRLPRHRHRSKRDKSTPKPEAETQAFERDVIKVLPHIAQDRDFTFITRSEASVTTFDPSEIQPSPAGIKPDTPKPLPYQQTNHTLFARLTTADLMHLIWR